MLTRQQVDVYAAAARDLAEARAHVQGAAVSPNGLAQEFVGDLGKLREIAAAVGVKPYLMEDYASIEAVDYAGVHFYALNGKVR